MSIRKLLVANRGEIAVRVFRTCRELGVATVAVVAPDGTARFMLARPTTSSTSRATSTRRSIRAAKSTGADAIHPGYGFLAERGDFADAVEAAGLTWIGPTPDALRRGGDKIEAKQTARDAGVPVLPDGDPHEVGFPLLVKAAAGGGGRGMRIVRSQAELDDALAAAKREAVGAFGDGALYCERYLERPRHVEVQLLADAHGTVIAVGERDCSVQRRHQKVLEESPAPSLDARLRARMLDAAVAFGEAVGYRGAGTVEFVVDGEEFFFLELNGRIQVEHPVTEAVTGLDLIEHQIRIAEGERLESTSHEAEARGRSPPLRRGSRDIPSHAGRIERLDLPSNNVSRKRIRVDAGVEEGDEVGIAYCDPMIAKLIAHGTRPRRRARHARRGPRRDRVSGITTNLPFLRWLVSHPVVRAGEATTAFLTEHPPLSPVRSCGHRLSGAPWRLNLPVPSAASPPDVDVESHREGATHGASTVVAPMPGTVIRVEVEAGSAVRARSALVVLEAMKMEIPVHSPFEAVVKAVHVAQGDRVAGGALLVELES